MTSAHIALATALINFSLINLAPLPGAASGRTLTVGAGQAFAQPSAAIAAAHDGDTVLIQPGSYFDCAIVPQNRLVIEGAAQGVVITDKTCQGKALLVIDGDHVTIRDLTLARARVPDGNGAGIRLEAPSLLVQRVGFDDDSVGILSGGAGGEVRVEDSIFSGGGSGGDKPSFAVMVAASALLRVTGSTFQGVAGGQIFSAAARTEIIGNHIGTGTGSEPAPAVQAVAGAVIMEDNVITVGPNPPRRDAAVALWDGATGTLRGNRLVNQTGKKLVFLLDWTWHNPVLERNVIGPGDERVSTAGIWRHRASSEFRARKAEARALAGRIKRFIKGHLWR